MVRYLLVELIYLGLNSRFDMRIIYLWLIIFSVFDDVFIDSDVLFN
jgi:hypothetical protein